MNDPNVKIKQQIVDKIKTSSSILVTVGRGPTVDDLSAALGLALMLNNMGKHATAIFSGSIPPAITFLEPDKVFEGTADSLRDFIIALDKEKADHLRYKIEGDVVKIFITPYRTTITSDDLQFSQGDFNVELVLALGVANKDHLDASLAAHGQILQDVTIATFSAGEQTSDLGVVDWHDESASSLCEMVTAISESLKTDKSLLDKQIATALLTGIVFATDRFSNPRTTSKVMTMAAQLMAAGADQQLIASKLDESHVINSSSSVSSIKNMSETDGAVDMPLEADNANPSVPVDEPGTLRVAHEEAAPEVPEQPAVTEPIIDPEITESSTLPPEQPAESQSTLPDPVADQSTIPPAISIPSHSYITGSEPNVGASLNSATQSSDGPQNVDIFASGQESGNPAASDVDTTAAKTKELFPPDDMQSTLPPAQSEQPASIPKPEPIVPPEQPAPQPEPIMQPEPVADPVESAESAQPSLVPTALPPLPEMPAMPPADLPLPPPLPDFSALPASASDPFDFAANSLAASPSSIATTQPASVADDPSAYRIPG